MKDKSEKALQDNFEDMVTFGKKVDKKESRDNRQAKNMYYRIMNYSNKAEMSPTFKMNGFQTQEYQTNQKKLFQASNLNFTQKP